MRTPLIYIALAFFTLLGYSQANAQIKLQYENQRVQGNTLYFDVYMQATSGSYYLGNADLVFTYAHANFSSPSFNFYATPQLNSTTSGQVLKTASASTANYTVSTTIGTAANSSTNRLIINILSPGRTNSSALAKIDAVDKHYIGTFSVTGLTTTTTFPDLQWVESGSGIITKVYEHVAASSYRSSLASITASEPTLTAPEPIAIDADDFFASDTSDTQIQLTINNLPAGAKILILANDGSINDGPADGVQYISNTDFTSSSSSLIDENDSVKVVYKGTGSPVTITGLKEGTAYTFKVYTYVGGDDGATENYQLVDAPSITITTHEEEPAANPTFVSITENTPTSMKLTWADAVGTGARTIVIARPTKAVSKSPIDGTSYTDGSQVWGAGSSLGDSSFVVYDGLKSTTEVTVTGLDQNKDYHFAIFSYNGTGAAKSYVQASPARGNSHTYLTLSAKVFLEGAYTAPNTMSAGSITVPTTHPYSGTPYPATINVSGAVVTVPANVVDWVLVSLRKSSTGAAATESETVATYAAFVKTDGSIVDVDGTSPLTIETSEAGELFLVVYHRNHLPVMSNAKLSINGSNFYHDFTTGSDYQAVGATYDPQADLGSGKSGMYAGRVENATSALDIDAADRTAVWNEANLTGTYMLEDCDFDGQINAGDRSIIDNNSGISSQIP